MKTHTKDVLFVGGQRDGSIYRISLIGNHIPPVYYLTKRLTPEERRDHHIDDTRAWKFPEEVYEYDRLTGNFHYRNTVVYKTT